MKSLNALRMRVAREETGIAMIVAIGVVLVASLLIAVMFSTVVREQSGTTRQRNVTSARQAAEAGVDKAIFELGQSVNGTDNWSTYQTSYDGSAGHTFSGTVGKGSYTGSIKPSGSNLVITMKGFYPASNTTNPRVLKVTIARGAPEGLDFAMFASKGIDIHHHGSSWLSPQVVTTKVHSNGYINLDYSSEFNLDQMSAVGAVTFQKGGGSSTGGTIQPQGYHWLDPFNNLCYPGGVAPLGTTCAKDYSGNATITGNIQAGSVIQGNRGNVVASGNAPPITETGIQLTKTNGDILTGSYKGPGGTLGAGVHTNKPGSDCSWCNQGTAATAGQVGGTITVQSGFKPDTIPFPIVSYSHYQQLAHAQTLATPSIPHEFNACSSGSPGFLPTITTNTALYKKIDPITGNLLDYVPNTHMGMPDVLLLQGDWFVNAGNCDLQWNDILARVAAVACAGNNNFNSATSCNGTSPGAKASAPVILVRGSLVVSNGSITAHSPLAVVGNDNAKDFIQAPSASPATPVTFNIQKMLASGTQSGVLAAGGSIDSSDYDSDSPWTNPSTYEWWKASPMYVRGIVYSAIVSGNEKNVTPANQHWHNSDPKNLIKVFGAQLGAQLHNCMNFTFTYDPIVRTVFTSSPGSVKILDYQELAPGSSL